MIRKFVFTILLLTGAVAAAPNLYAAELLMFEDDSCGWCHRWHAEFGPSYPTSAEGRRAPLRRVDIRDQDRVGATLGRSVYSTPTFVLVDGGKEIGRIVGYPGGSFYRRIDELLQRLPPPSAAPTTGGPAQTAIICTQSGCS
jgi:hypothetical protein